MSKWLGLEGKIAIITGGGSGIGKGCAEGLASVGVITVLADIAEEVGEETAHLIRKKYNVNSVFIKCDVTERKSVTEMVEKVENLFSRIDILVNNAGILIPRLLVDPAGKQEITDQIWDKMIAINQKGIFLCAQAVARHMIKNGIKGVIINMSSESGLEGSEGQSVYAATKAAIYSMTRSWAKELGKYGIRVIGVAPGIIEGTALRSKEYEEAVAYTRGMTVEEFREKYKNVSIPLGRMGTVEDVANLVCFLASDRASYIHGTTINISGGKSRG